MNKQNVVDYVKSFTISSEEGFRAFISHVQDESFMVHVSLTVEPDQLWDIPAYDNFDCHIFDAYNKIADDNAIERQVTLARNKANNTNNPVPQQIVKLPRAFTIDSAARIDNGRPTILSQHYIDEFKVGIVRELKIMINDYPEIFEQAKASGYSTYIEMYGMRDVKYHDIYVSHFR